jgi:hypothetical protein
MKNLFNDIETSEKNRILEMHKKRGYNTIIVESPMDSMFYQGDDYVKDAGQSLSDVLQSVKEKIESIPDRIFAELPNPEKLIQNASDFFGKDVTKMSEDEVKSSLESMFSSKNLGEGFWSDYLKYDNSKDDESLETPLTDVKGGIEQKIGFMLQRIFGINVLSFGMLHSFLFSTIADINISPASGMVISIVAIVVIGLIRNLMRFTRERYKF